MLRLAVPFSALLLALSAGSAAAQQPAPASPCADSLYLVLKARPLDALSEREYQYFSQRDRACVDYQALRSLVDRPRAAPAPSRERPETESRTEGSPLHPGADVFVTNHGKVPIVVNTVRVYDCVNLRSSSCGTHHPKMLIRPGQERRVLTIRYSSPELRSSYRYRYHVSVAEPDEGR